MSPIALLILQLIAKYGLPYVYALLDTLGKTNWTVADLKALESLIDKPGEGFFVKVP